MFVTAGALRLQTLYAQELQLFMVHERFMSQEAAVEALGLPPNLQTTYVLFHIVKKLFTDVLNQLPTDLFQQGNGHKAVDWQREAQIRLPEQRLFDFLHLETIQVPASNKNCSITTQWLPALLEPQANIEIQYHAMACGRNLQKSILIAADGMFS